MPTLLLDNSVNLDIIVAQWHSYKAIINKVDANNTGVNWTGVIKLGIKVREGLVIYLNELNGLEVVGNSLIIDVSVLENKLACGKYNYDIREDYADGTSQKICKGLLIVQNSISK